MPAGWPAVYARLMKSDNTTDPRARRRPRPDLRRPPGAVADLKRIVRTPTAPASERRLALEALIDKHIPDLAPMLHELLADQARAANGPARAGRVRARGDAEIRAGSLRRTDAGREAGRHRHAASRKEYALALLDAVDKKTVPRATCLGLCRPADVCPRRQKGHRAAPRSLGRCPRYCAAKSGSS